jgi:beta-fructofuranosidase
MVLRLDDKWVWDFWFAHRGGQDHIFYLQAPRELGRPELRHRNATIGHAVSSNRRDWQVLPDAIRPGADGSWDDLATWTGSAIEHESRWYMLYTGVSRADDGLVQRIGLAVSDDLVQWSKHVANPVLEADPRWYELLRQGRYPHQAWRDPWLFRRPEDNLLHVLVTARSPLGAPDGAGVLGHACSVDLINWEVLPPLTEPGEFAQLEVPQLVRLDGSHTILFSCLAEDHSRRRLDRLGIAGRSGTFALSSRDFSGPYVAGKAPVTAPTAADGALYAGKLLEVEGEWRFMAFRGVSDRDFVGELTDPLPVALTGDGQFLVGGQ